MNDNTLKYPWPRFLRATLLKLNEHPMYVKTYDKYDSQVILITSEEDLLAAMLTKTKEWFEAQFIPRPEHYNNKPYEEFFLSNIKMTPEKFDEFVEQYGQSVNSFVEQFIKEGNYQKRYWEDTQETIKVGNFYKRIAENGYTDDNDPVTLYNYLKQQIWNNRPMFELKTFD